MLLYQTLSFILFCNIHGNIIITSLQNFDIQVLFKIDCLPRMYWHNDFSAVSLCYTILSLHSDMLASNLPEVVMFLTCIHELPDSNFPETSTVPTVFIIFMCPSM
jgi:hypothetical protein